MFIPVEATPPSFKDFTLILPAIAVGNVAQLAVDLIVSTLCMRRVGFLHTDCLVPMVGPSPYATSAKTAGELHTTAEDAEKKLAVLQIRSPIIHSRSRKFRKVLVSWIKASGFAQTVVLSSSHAYQRDDQQLKGTPLRYLVTPAMQKTSGTALTELGWMEMEKVSAFPGLVDTNAEPRLSVPGGGITKGLFTDSCQEELCLAVVLVFCSEGDNVPDAFTLVNHLNDWLLLVDNDKRGPQKWKVPSSWTLLFGNSHPPSIF
ncbi:Proteasome assembly chaperone 2 [Merluccius polli]|uniref:Proteasome assembly chaperone 2 n=1 Tax=Merluccius polli TaxID=89951 RepID=A0AA47MHN9_MERPO|nr:Proteasome assembly chaperone 2 [Merluccius polli]KAK0146390.1 Proteasome assembly chaperone 2 [Merluccius polli]